ncbi:MAG TPA: alkaline phosphatase, partial [Actinomycetota bacterium]|nr:alkaline phosphatase [Actinomycetota bacterium]
MKKLAFVLGILVLGSSASPAPAESIGGASPSRASAGTSFVIGAAGDIACASNPYPQTKPDNCQYDNTADLLARVTLVLALGDNQYDTGSYAAYTTYYDPTWGQYVANTKPVPGNHEYAQDPSSTPSGYFRYFGDRVKGPDGLGYYSFDVPQGCTPGQGVCWHFIAL